MKQKDIALNIRPNRNPWQDLETSSNKAPFPSDYNPQIVEMFDSQGLLWGLAHKTWFYQTSRSASYKPEYIACYLDGKLSMFLLGKTLLLNRMGLMSLSQVILTGKLREHLNLPYQNIG